MAGTQESGERPTPSGTELTRQLYGDSVTSERQDPLDGVLRPGSTLKNYSPTQLFPLMRLVYVRRQSDAKDAGLVFDDVQTRLLNKAKYSLYQDAVAAGVGHEARIVLGMQEQRR